jgi:hypothetical protein
MASVHVSFVPFEPAYFEKRKDDLEITLMSVYPSVCIAV